MLKTQEFINTSTQIDTGKNLQKGELITRPKNTWIEVANFNFLDLDANRNSLCLLYKTPFKKKPGKLKAILNPKKQDCLKLSEEEGVASISEIYNLKFELNESFKLYVDDKIFLYKLFNYGKYRHEKFEQPIKETAYRGIKLLANYKNKVEERPLNKGICRKMNNDCSVEFDKCYKCEFSWFEIIDSKCSKKLTRVCGVNNCGKKNEPACIRGFKTVNLNTDLYCINDSPFGFCDKGLKVICLNSTLVCI